MFNKRSHFTLIELIVVIAVLGILSAIVIPNISNINEKAKIAAVESNVRNIQTAVDMFHLDYEYYPTDKQPEFIEDKDNPRNPSGFLVGIEKINFDKDRFVTEYLRDIPADGNTYYVDAWGIVNSDLDNVDGEENTPSPPTSNSKIKIENAMHHSIALLDTGDVYSWGYNSNGQLGLGHEVNQTTPQLVTFFKDKKVKEINVGGFHSFAILESGEVYSWGYNANGILGLGHSIEQNTPQLISFFNDKKVRNIISGYYHTFAIMETGEVYSWGSNSGGQLALGNKIHQNTPQLVTFFNNKKVKDIVLGGNHSFALLDTGEVYSWGSNSGGQLGLGNEINQNTPQLVTFFNNKKVNDIVLGGNHSFALLDTGEVYSWGSNTYGQLGLGDEINQSNPQLIPLFNGKKVKDAILGFYHSTAILETGEVYSWGFNSSGQLGLGNEINQNTPQLVTFFNNKKVKEILSGRYYSFALLENGEVYSWGNNIYGQLVLDNQTNQSTPQLVTFFSDIIK